MDRIWDRLEGLALPGSGGVGSLRFILPDILLVRRELDRAENTSSAERPLLFESPASGPGRRKLTLSAAAGELAFEFSVIAPEISGIPGDAQEAAPKLWLLHWPLSSDEWERIRASGPELVVLANARHLLLEGRPLVLALLDLRTHLGARPVVWLPRVALPHRLALLVYLGADLLDSTEALWQATEGVFLDPTFGVVRVTPEEARPACGCSACRRTPSGSLEEHALFALEEEFGRVRSAIGRGRLRELVEIRLSAEPLTAEILRYADRELGSLLEERVPVASTGVRNYVLAESHRRPEILRFQRRFLERYRPPPSKRVLLVLPCSKTKPYRRSPSHRRFLRAVEDLAPLARVHVVSVTSPLGLVPRELEDVYPARHYDIPVTGEWSVAEQETVRNALAHIFRTGAYARAIFHLDREEYGFLRDVSGPGIECRWTVTGDRTSSPENLRALHTEVATALEGSQSIPGGPLSVVREELEEIAAVQFGRAAARLLFQPPVRLAGRPWFQRLTDGDRVDLATWREERGFFQLTVAGGHRILPAHPLEVAIDAEVELQGDLFCPGVASADPKIRVGDAVVVVRNGALAGVGEAALPGRLMVELRRGLAARIRHRAHALPRGSQPPIGA